MDNAPPLAMNEPPPVQTIRADPVCPPASVRVVPPMMSARAGAAMANVTPATASAIAATRAVQVR